MHVVQLFGVLLCAVDATVDACSNQGTTRSCDKILIILPPGNSEETKEGAKKITDAVEKLPALFKSMSRGRYNLTTVVLEGSDNMLGPVYTKYTAANRTKISILKMFRVKSAIENSSDWPVLYNNVHYNYADFSLVMIFVIPQSNQVCVPALGYRTRKMILICMYRSFFPTETVLHEFGHDAFHFNHVPMMLPKGRISDPMHQTTELKYRNSDLIYNIAHLHEIGWRNLKSYVHGESSVKHTVKLFAYDEDEPHGASSQDVYDGIEVKKGNKRMYISFTTRNEADLQVMRRKDQGTIHRFVYLNPCARHGVGNKNVKLFQKDVTYFDKETMISIKIIKVEQKTATVMIERIAENQVTDNTMQYEKDNYLIGETGCYSPTKTPCVGDCGKLTHNTMKYCFLNENQTAYDYCAHDCDIKDKKIVKGANTYVRTLQELSLSTSRLNDGECMRMCFQDRNCDFFSTFGYCRGYSLVWVQKKFEFAYKKTESISYDEMEQTGISGASCAGAFECANGDINCICGSGVCEETYMQGCNKVEGLCNISVRDCENSDGIQSSDGKPCVCALGVVCAGEKSICHSNCGANKRCIDIEARCSVVSIPCYKQNGIDVNSTVPCMCGDEKCDSGNPICKRKSSSDPNGQCSSNAPTSAPPAPPVDGSAFDPSRTCADGPAYDGTATTCGGGKTPKSPTTPCANNSACANDGATCCEPNSRWFVAKSNCILGVYKTSEYVGQLKMDECNYTCYKHGYGGMVTAKESKYRKYCSCVDKTLWESEGLRKVDTSDISFTWFITCPVIEVYAALAVNENCKTWAKIGVNLTCELPSGARCNANTEMDDCKCKINAGQPCKGHKKPCVHYHSCRKLTDVATNCAEDDAPNACVCTPNGNGRQ